MTGPCLRILLATAWLLAAACDTAPEARFRALPAAQTGLDFANRLVDTDSFNILNYPYYYNGGGVAIGDVNGDGWPDLFLTANQQPNRLYLNQGGLRFVDVTETAGVGGQGDWTTGAVMADVNGDGWLDIYVNYFSGFMGQTGRNELFLNRGDGTFDEVAAAWGLDLVGYGTQGVFFDYDRDGDLDLFQLNHSIHPARTVGDTSQRQLRDLRAGDRLFRQDEGHFTEVTEAAGLISSRLGYGLSALAADLDGDGWPDLYVCNDFHEDDYLYLNQGDGTFREVLRDRVGHTSRFSMGSDMGDVNGDGWPDLLTLDMKPAREAIRKTAEPPETWDVFQLKLRFGYYHQYPRNALQVNQGGGYFAEVAQLAGLDATDWSWAVLFADLDNDGGEDLFITNGIYRRPNDMDYLKFISDPAVVRQLAGAPAQEDLRFIAEMPSIPLPNYAFRRVGELAYENMAAAWGLGVPGFSNGAAYADLDGDGDLDLVVNQLQAPVALYENRSRQQDSLAYLRLRLVGTGANTFGTGARVWAWAGGRLHYREMQPVRGFLSSVEPVLHLGLAQASQVDSLRIVWPDGRERRYRALAANQTHHLRQSEAEMPGAQPGPSANPWLMPVALDWPYRHRDDGYTGFNQEKLLPHSLSMEGPRLAAADVDGDGRVDVYAGGALQQAGGLFRQQADGAFAAPVSPLWHQQAQHEEVAALFFDADGDGAPDLYVVSGGGPFNEGAAALQDQLFLNDGQGNFRLATDRLPAIRTQGSCVAAADFDGDGDLDLFVGSRAVPGSYGLPPRAFLLENDGHGYFTDVTEALVPDLLRPGMLTDAAWADVDGDGRPDLWLAGEWMPLTLFRNRAEGWVRDTLAGTGGWWQRLLPFDADGDGDLDLVAGNLGLNSSLRAGADTPCRLYVKDFDGNGATDPVICYHREGKLYPWASRDELIGQMIGLRRRFPRYADFAEITIAEMFSPAERAGALVREVQTFASVYVENLGGGRWAWRPLPQAAQWTPVRALAATDLDGDGQTDLLLGGNFYGVGPNRGRYDARALMVLRGDGSGHWQPIPAAVSGATASGQVTDILVLPSAGETRVIVARHDESLLGWRIGK